MKTTLKTWHKIALTVAAFVAAVICFMIRLPSTFSHMDKEMHSLFYFLAAAFLNILFAKKETLLYMRSYSRRSMFLCRYRIRTAVFKYFIAKKSMAMPTPKTCRPTSRVLLFFLYCGSLYVIVAAVFRLLKPKSANDLPAHGETGKGSHRLPGNFMSRAFVFIAPPVASHTSTIDQYGTKRAVSKLIQV